MKRFYSGREQNDCETKGRSRELLGRRILDLFVEVTEANAKQQKNRVNDVVPAHRSACLQLVRVVSTTNSTACDHCLCNNHESSSKKVQKKL